MEQYQDKLCKTCKHFLGIRRFSEYSVKLVCRKFSFRTISNEEQAETLTELKVGCWEEKEKEEIISLKPNVHGIEIDLKKAFKKIKKKK